MIRALTNLLNRYILLGMKINIYECLRCGHEWPSKQEQPRICPKCKSPYWDRPRKNQTDDKWVKEGGSNRIEDKKPIKAWQEELSDILSTKEISVSPLYEEAYHTFIGKFDELHSDAFNNNDWEKAYYCLRAFVSVVSEINECCNPQGDFDEEKAIQILHTGREMLEKIDAED